ncbi:MAG: hypothetical protein LBC74_05935, partial [Planctomycetaceae bacterium]|nr:hypothetical protein [Planctomycetaceae bacterium]
MLARRLLRIVSDGIVIAVYICNGLIFMIFLFVKLLRFSVNFVLFIIVGGQCNSFSVRIGEIIVNCLLSLLFCQRNWFGSRISGFEVIANRRRVGLNCSRFFCWELDCFM